MQFRFQRLLQEKGKVDAAVLGNGVQPGRDAEGLLDGVLSVASAVAGGVRADERNKLVFIAGNASDVGGGRDGQLFVLQRHQHQVQHVLGHVQRLAQGGAVGEAALHIGETDVVAILLLGEDSGINIFHGCSSFSEQDYFSPAACRMDFRVPALTSSVLCRLTGKRFPVMGLNQIS